MCHARRSYLPGLIVLLFLFGFVAPPRPAAAQEFECPEGLVYDEASEICLPPDQVPVEEEPIDVEDATDDAETTDDATDDVVDDGSDGALDEEATDDGETTDDAGDATEGDLDDPAADAPALAPDEAEAIENLTLITFACPINWNPATREIEASREMCTEATVPDVTYTVLFDGVEQLTVPFRTDVNLVAAGIPLMTGMWTIQESPSEGLDDPFAFCAIYAADGSPRLTVAETAPGGSLDILLAAGEEVNCEWYSVATVPETIGDPNALPIGGLRLDGHSCLYATDRFSTLEYLIATCTEKGVAVVEYTASLAGVFVSTQAGPTDDPGVDFQTGLDSRLLSGTWTIAANLPPEYAESYIYCSVTTAAGATTDLEPETLFDFIELDMQPDDTGFCQWFTADDLPRLRGWATAANPVWRDGLLPLAEVLKAEMDEGLVPGEDDGAISWNPYPTEHSAGFFAFMSLVHPDEAARADYAERARTLLMYAINEAAKGPAEGQPFRDPYFSIFDRSRWWGENFPLTVDWIYPLLTAGDKATIRQVFLRWVEENANAQVTGAYNHPEPIGVVNDSALLADPLALRWAGNNYFTAHMRNIGLMALAFDAADDPDGELSGNLAQATGAWLYMVDEVLRGDFRGGLTAEGFEYSQQALAYVVQFLLALRTAGQDDPAVWGPQVVVTDNPFWDELIPACVHSLSPVTVTVPDWEWMGPVYQPAWYGDGQNYWAPDFIGLLGALGRYDDLTGNQQRLDTLRWLQTHLPPGGAEGLIPLRVAEAQEVASTAIFYFLLFDPEAQAGTDPRPNMPLGHFAEGIGRLMVRTSWEDDAAWFTYALGGNTVDHQHSDGNMFEFYRAGEWLTKERTGYGFNIGGSDYHNTIAVENDPPDHNEPDGYRHILWQRGSQWMYVASGDPEILGPSIGDGYVYALGDATNLYNSEVELSTDVEHVSRSIVWLQPDHIVVYDRASSKSEGRFKRFWLNLPAEATVAGNVSTMTTAGGQQLVVTTLLPTDAEIGAEPAEPLEEANEVAIGEPMHFRLRVEAPGGPRETRFLHVLQGADAGSAADSVMLVESGAGTPFVGAVVADTVVLFPVDVGVEVGELTWAVPAGTARHLVTGLVPGGGYDVETQMANGELSVTIRAGSAQQADDGGVLVLNLNA